VVFHLASIVHTVKQSGVSDQDYYQLNVEGTKKILEAAKKSEVRSFVYFSSIKAVADPGRICVDEGWQKYPNDVYGKSKRIAEEHVLALNNEGINASVIRSVLVYGKGVKGNLLRMIDAIDRKKMPNINQTKNKRSMIGVEDLASLAITMAENKRSANEAYFATDGQIYSTKDIYDLISTALGRKPGISIPVCLIKALGLSLGIVEKILPFSLPVTKEMATRLVGSACYRSDKASRELGWIANSTLESEIQSIIDHYKKTRKPC